MSYPRVVGKMFYVDANNAVPVTQAIEDGRLDPHGSLWDPSIDREWARAEAKRMFERWPEIHDAPGQWWGNLTPWLP